MTDENEFRRIPGFVANLEVNRAGIVRDGDTGEVYHDLANPEEIESAFPDIMIEEQWELIENGKCEISERGAIRRSDTKEIIRSRVGNRDPKIQAYLYDVFPKRHLT
jgi:hypothetical protein